MQSLTKAMSGLTTALKPVAKTALTTGGGALGTYLAGPIGGSVGSALGARLSKLIGTGDYTCNSVGVNSLMKGAANPFSSFATTSTGLIAKHRDYIGDVFTGPNFGVFSIVAIPVNPGLSYFTPYLANIAQNFEEYKVRGMVFEFISTTSPYTTGNTLGSVILAAEYNSANPAFTSKPQMENSDFAISVRFDEKAMYGIECASNVQNSYYVRSGTSTLPVTTTDLCTMYVATQPGSNFPSNTTVGELWVSYDIEFMRPRVSPARFGYAHFFGNAVNPTPTQPINLAAIATSSIIYGALSGTTFTNNGSSTCTLTFPNANVGDTYYLSALLQDSVSPASGALIGTYASTGITLINVLTYFTTPHSTAIFQTPAAGTMSAGVYFTIVAEDEPGVIPSITLNSATSLIAGVGAQNLGVDITVIDLGNGFSNLLL
jgi:hypothetical protein